MHVCCTSTVLVLLRCAFGCDRAACLKRHAPTPTPWSGTRASLSPTHGVEAFLQVETLLNALVEIMPANALSIRRIAATGDIAA